MYPEKVKRSTRRFYRRVASYRRRFLRRLHGDGETGDALHDRDVSRPATLQELRVDEAYRQDLEDTEFA